jgi:hypothetical protein
MSAKCKYMISAIIVFMAGIFVSVAQTPAEQTKIFLDRFSTHPLQFSYRLTILAADKTITESGEVVVCEDSYCLTNGGFESRSDGESVWNVNEDSQEVIIQPATDVDANPILMIRSLEEHFKQVSTTYSAKDGGKVVMAAFAAEKGYMGISDVVLYISDNKLVAADFKTKDGISLNVDIPSFTYLDELPSSSKFSYSKKNFDSSWVVTDLR